MRHLLALGVLIVVLGIAFSLGNNNEKTFRRHHKSTEGFDQKLRAAIKRAHSRGSIHRLASKYQTEDDEEDLDGDSCTVDFMNMTSKHRDIGLTRAKQICSFPLELRICIMKFLEVRSNIYTFDAEEVCRLPSETQRYCAYELASRGTTVLASKDACKGLSRTTVDCMLVKMDEDALTASRAKTECTA